MCSLPPVTAVHPIKGQIQVIFGPMFSGKTTELIRRCKRYQLTNYNCIMVKYAHDNRYDEESVATHDSQKLQAYPVLKLQTSLDHLETFEVIGIDEGQFFPNIVDVAEHLANKGKIVIVAALDGTYQREGFGSILELVPKAESVIKLTAVCMQCFRDAAYTKRKSADTQLEVIGGADKYMAVCRECHNRNESPVKDACVQTPSKIETETSENCSKNVSTKAKHKLFTDDPEEDGCPPMKKRLSALWEPVQPIV